MTISYNKNKLSQNTYYLGILVAVSTLLWAFWPICVDLVQTWSENEDYSHGFFIVPVVIYLIWTQKPEIDLENHVLNWLGFIALSVGILLYFVGLLAQVRTFAYFSFVFTIWGSIFFLFGYSFFKKFGWELFILIFMLPLPARLYASLTLPLQLGVTKISSVVLQFLGIPVYREGNILQLPSITLEVVNACSGLRSILTIVVLSFVVSCMSLKGNPQRILLIIMSIPLAMLANLIRVTVIAFLAQQGNTNFVDGTGHTLLGLALFGLSLFLLTLFAKGIECILPAR